LRLAIVVLLIALTGCAGLSPQDRREQADRLAARRNDVVRLVTVAGNLDHRAWTEMHGLPALTDSLNPADEWRALRTLPQRHFIGGRDEVVGRRVTDAYLARFPSNQQPEVVTIPDFDHVCCWIERWDSIWF